MVNFDLCVHILTGTDRRQVASVHVPPTSSAIQWDRFRRKVTNVLWHLGKMPVKDIWYSTRLAKFRRLQLEGPMTY